MGMSLHTKIPYLDKGEIALIRTPYSSVRNLDRNAFTIWEYPSFQLPLLLFHDIMKIHTK